MGILVIKSELNRFVIKLISPDCFSLFFFNRLCSFLAAFLHSFLKPNPIPVLFEQLMCSALCRAARQNNVRFRVYF